MSQGRRLLRSREETSPPFDHGACNKGGGGGRREKGEPAAHTAAPCLLSSHGVYQEMKEPVGPGAEEKGGEKKKGRERMQSAGSVVYAGRLRRPCSIVRAVRQFRPAWSTGGEGGKGKKKKKRSEDRLDRGPASSELASHHMSASPGPG